MTDNLTIYDNGLEAMQALTPFYQEAAVAKIREAGALDSWFALLQSAAVDPARLTAAALSGVLPYAAPQRVNELLENALEGGFLAGDEAGGFRLTGRGRTVLTGFFDTAHELIANAPVLSSPEMERLTDLLQRLVAAVAVLPNPLKKPNLARSRWTDPGEGAPAAVRVDQYLTDLNGFRDDAHIAAWQIHDIDGRSWETLTFLWHDDAHSAADLLEKLPRRGYTEEDYAASLAALGQRGWAEDDADGWQVTDKGRAVRQEAEDETDRLFFAGWSALSETELNNLNELLESLANRLKEAAAAAEPA